MHWLVAGLIIFFAVHSISIINKPWRDRMVAKMGEGMILGLAALVNCPIGIHIIPTGFPYDANIGRKIPVDPRDVIPPVLIPPPTL